MNSDYRYQSYRPGTPAAVGLRQAAAPAKRKYSVNIVLVAVVVLLVIVFGSKLVSAIRTHAAGQPALVAAKPDTDAMTSKINAVLADYPYIDISVAVTNLTDGSSFTYGENAGYIGASTAKLITASLFLHEVEAQKYTLQSSISGRTANYQLQQMIENSDNAAWQAFNDKLGHPALQAWANRIGMTTYDTDTNIMTTKDIAALLQKLYNNQLLNEADTKLMLSYMALANRTDLIASAVPADTKVYHKAGWLEDRVHDAAIIDDGTTPYVLVIFSKMPGGYDLAVGQKIFQEITESTLRTYSP